MVERIKQKGWVKGFILLLFGVWSLWSGAKTPALEAKWQFSFPKINNTDLKLRRYAQWVHNHFELDRWVEMGEHAFFSSNIELATDLSLGVPSTATEPVRYLFKGILAFSKGDLTAAKNYFEGVTRSSNPMLRSKGYFFLGEMTYRSLKDPDSDLRELERSHYYFQKAIETFPKNPMAHFGIARRFIHLREWGKAIDNLRLASEIDPQRFLPRFNLGIIFSEQKRWKEAFRELKAASMLRPNDVPTTKELIVVAHKIGRHQLSQDLLKDYLDRPNVSSEEAAPLIQMVLFRRIELDYRAGQIRKALSQYQALARRFSRIAEIQLRIGMCLRALGHLSKARQAFEAFIKKRPNDPVGFFEMGVLCFKMGDYVAASQSFIQALRRRPNDEGNIWLWVVKSLEKLNLFSEALFVLDKADMQPQLEAQYRKIVRNKILAIQKKHHLISGQVEGITFEELDRRLARMVSREAAQERRVRL